MPDRTAASGFDNGDFEEDDAAVGDQCLFTPQPPAKTNVKKEAPAPKKVQEQNKVRPQADRAVTPPQKNLRERSPTPDITTDANNLKVKFQKKMMALAKMAQHPACRTV